MRPECEAYVEANERATGVKPQSDLPHTCPMRLKREAFRGNTYTKLGVKTQEASHRYTSHRLSATYGQATGLSATASLAH
jgi:hypothetical protein